MVKKKSTYIREEAQIHIEIIKHISQSVSAYVRKKNKHVEMSKRKEKERESREIFVEREVKLFFIVNIK